MWVAGLCVLFSLASVCWPQGVSSSVNGVLLDPSGSGVAGASCKLASQGNGATRTVHSGVDGRFTFPIVLAGVYTLHVEAPGFKVLELKDIVVTSQEVRTLGSLSWQVGEVRESVSVTAEAAALQLSTAERSGLVTGTQLNDLALKGRDFFAMLQPITGVVGPK